MSHTPVTIHAMAAISVRLDPETHNAVKRIARQQRRSAAALARIWIEDSVAAAQADTPTTQIPGQTAIPMDSR